MNEEIRDIGWYYLPVVLLTSALALVVALFTNNIQRRYPTFWFYPSPVKAKVSPETSPQVDETPEGTPKEKMSDDGIV